MGLILPFTQKKKDCEQAEALLAKGDAEGALKLFRKAKHNPGLVDVAKHCLAKGNVRKATELFREAGYKNGLRESAEHHLQRGNFTELEKILREIHGEVPPDEYRRIGKHFLDSGELQKAEKAFLAVEDHQALNAVAGRHLAKNDVSNALRLYRKLNDSDGVRRIADFHFGRGELDLAEKLFTEINDEDGRGRVVARRTELAAGTSNAEDQDVP